MKRGVLAWMIALAGLGAYELYALAAGDQLLSEAAWDGAANYPLIPFAAGGVAMHFFWQAKKVYDERRKDTK